MRARSARLSTCGNLFEKSATALKLPRQPRGLLDLHAPVRRIVVRTVFVPADEAPRFVPHGAGRAGDALFGGRAVAITDALDRMRAAGRGEDQQEGAERGPRSAPLVGSGHVPPEHFTGSSSPATVPPMAQNLSTVASRLSMATGLARNPAACICVAATFTSVCALSRTTGMSLTEGSRCCSARKAQASMVGIMTSRRMTQGMTEAVRNCSRASTPFEAGTGLYSKS